MPLLSFQESYLSVFGDQNGDTMVTVPLLLSNTSSSFFKVDLYCKKKVGVQFVWCSPTKCITRTLMNAKYQHNFALNSWRPTSNATCCPPFFFADREFEWFEFWNSTSLIPSMGDQWTSCWILFSIDNAWLSKDNIFSVNLSLPYSDFNRRGCPKTAFFGNCRHKNRTYGRCFSSVCSSASCTRGSDTTLNHHQGWKLYGRCEASMHENFSLRYSSNSRAPFSVSGKWWALAQIGCQQRTACWIF